MRNEAKGKFRLFGWINPVDVLIVIGIVALVWGAMIFSAPQQVSGAGDVTARYTVELKQKEAGFHTRIEKGATVYDSQKGYEIGTIIDVYAEVYREEVGDEQAEVIRRAAVEGLEYVYLVIEAPVQVSDHATSVGQYDLVVGKEVFVKSKTFAGLGFITDIEWKGTN